MSWKDLCDEIGLSPKEASGMLGAAERRCKQKPPYYKDSSSDDRLFLMPAEVAKIVREVADE